MLQATASRSPPFGPATPDGGLRRQVLFAGPDLRMTGPGDRHPNRSSTGRPHEAQVQGTGRDTGLNPVKGGAPWVRSAVEHAWHRWPTGGTALVSDPWLSAEDIAAHLGVTKDTVYAWIAEKGLPAHKVGRLWKFQTSEIDEWVRCGGATQRAPAVSDGT